jgi:hypothetical protein
MKPDQICSRFDALKRERSNIASVYDAIEKFVRPFSGEFFSDHQSESNMDWFKNREVYDSTAIHAAFTLSANIHGALTPPLVQWMTMRFRNDTLNEDHEASVWLEDCSDRVYAALMDSDFHLEWNEGCLDLTTFGECFVFEEEMDGKPGSLDFTAVPIKEGFFEPGWDGQPVAFYREINKTASELMDKFGDDAPVKVRAAYHSGKVEDRFKVILCVYERRDLPEIDLSGPVIPSLRPWGRKYIYYDDREEIGKEGGYYERPVFGAKWLESSDSKHGISPAMMAMPDILTLNQMAKDILIANEKNIDPPMVAQERGLFGDIDLKAGGLTIVRDMEQMPKPLMEATRLDFAQMQMSDYRQNVRMMFHIDDLQLKESPAMTATEVNARMDMMQRVLGPTFGYLKTYFLDPMVERTFGILHRAGKLADVPDSVMNAQAEFDVEYLGPLARAQKSDRARSMIAFAQQVAAIAEVRPDVLDVPDFDQIVRELGEQMNVPTELLRATEAVDQMRKRRQAAADQKEELENAQAAADVGQTALSLVENGK